MFRRIRMVLPLFFAFVLTLLPFLLLEFTQFQRTEIQKDRDLYLWEQEANNYLQLFSTLWSYELQINRRMVVFRQNQGEKILNSTKPGEAFEAEMRRRFPASLLPDVVYAGEVNRKTGKFELFKGSFFKQTRRKVFETILSSLVDGKKNRKTADLKMLNRFSEGALGQDLTFDLLNEFRRGRICYAKINNENRLLIWDYLENEKTKIAYFCFFKPEQMNEIDSIRLASRTLSKEFPEVLSVMVPVEDSDKSLKPIFDERVDLQQKKVVTDLVVSTANREPSRAEILPVGSVMKVGGFHILREFVDYSLPYEIWLLKRPEKLNMSGNEIFIFLLRLGYFSIWILVFLKVLINARPLGISIENWLTLIFVLIGVVPLIVLHIAGTFHLESSAFRQEQQAVKETIRQFEEADISGEAVLSEYREFCRTIESSPSWQKAMLQWDQKVWEDEIAKLPKLFSKTGLRLSAVYIYPPPVSKLKYFYSSFHGFNSDRDTSLANFYESWVYKSYYAIDPKLTENKIYEMPLFTGQEGDEILRLFMGNRGDSDLADLGNEKQFFYQNYILENGIPKNWYFFRANISDNFEKYLRTKVMDWNEIHDEVFYSLARTSYPDPEIILPTRGEDDKILGMIKKHAGRFINLAAATKARIFKKSSDNIVVVYPCRKSGNFILTAVITFRRLHENVFSQELNLGIILILLCIPVVLISRFISSYLVQPLKQVETGLKKVAEEDFSSRIHLNRQDELGVLSDAFDLMVDGIIERRNLGRFVSAGLDTKITQDEFSVANQLEKSFGAVLCSDIRSFTSMSEKYSVREIVSMLNEHMTGMSACINLHGGMVEQFIGDAILAVFIDKSEEEAAKKAVAAAIEMVRSHRSIIEKRNLLGAFPYEIGIGIEAGKIISGAVKAGNKNEYILVGHPRSQSEILEGKSKSGVSSRIVCSEKVKEAMDDVHFIPLSDGKSWEVVLSEDLP